MVLSRTKVRTQHESRRNQHTLALTTVLPHAAVGPFIQSERLSMYKEAAEKLVEVLPVS